MEVASRVYTQDVERMYEAKKSKTMAALCDVVRINEANKSETVAALQMTKYGPKHAPQIHSMVCTCFSTGTAGREAVQRFPLPNRRCCLMAVWYTCYHDTVWDQETDEKRGNYVTRNGVCARQSVSSGQSAEPETV